MPRELPHEIPIRAKVLGIYVPRDGRTRLVVVRKENSGRSEAINVAINAASEPLVAMIDGDSILEPDALLQVTRPFADDPTAWSPPAAPSARSTAAASCRAASSRSDAAAVDPAHPARRVPPQPSSSAAPAGPLGRVSSSSAARSGCSGATSSSRSAVSTRTASARTSSSAMRIHKQAARRGRDYRIVFVPEPVWWTEVPVDAKVLRNQRRRWHRGLWETLWAYRGDAVPPEVRPVGWLALPYYWLFELIAPLLELSASSSCRSPWVLGVVNVPFAILFLVLPTAMPCS